MSVKAYLKLIRPLNGLIAFVSVLLGAYLADNTSLLDHSARILAVAVAAFLFLSAGNVLNDIRDAKTDMVNKPYRPIPSGQVRTDLSLTFCILMFIIGLTLGATVGLVAFLVATCVVILLVLYTYTLRRVPFVGNAVVSVLTGLTFVSGGIAVRSIGSTTIPAMFAFLFTLVREIIKDIPDVKGDIYSGMTSLPISLGQKKSILVVYIISSLIIVATPIPYLMGIYSVYYLVAIIFGVDLVLVYCMMVLPRQPISHSAEIVANVMKYDIFAGLLAIYLGKFGPRLP